MKIVGWILIVFFTISFILCLLGKQWGAAVFGALLVGLGIYLVDKAKKKAQANHTK